MRQKDGTVVIVLKNFSPLWKGMPARPRRAKVSIPEGYSAVVLGRPSHHRPAEAFDVVWPVPSHLEPATKK